MMGKQQRMLFSVAKRRHPWATSLIRVASVRSFATSGTADDDFFAMFALPRRFQLDETLLKNNYRNMMKEIHPDKQKQQVASNDQMDDASVVTHAYVTLKRPHTRASYLMDLLGCSIEEDSSASPKLPPTFLMEMMEQRETLEEATDDEETLQKLRNETLERIAAVGEELQTALDQKDTTTAQQCAAMLQYYHRMEEAVVAKMDHR